MEAQVSPKKDSPFLGSILDFLEIAVFALILVSIMFAFFIRIVEVDGPSMNDTMAHGDHVVLSKAFYTPERGDIVVFNYGDKHLIKRVIGVAGDRINVSQLDNTVTLNDKVLEEPYVNYPHVPGTDEEIMVPEGYVFVMGDHRNDSHDSRRIGCIPVEDIIGKAVWRFWPLSSFGGLYDGVEDSIYVSDGTA